MSDGVVRHGEGSRVVEERPPVEAAAEEKLVLRLKPKRGVKWDESVVDNEHLNKKSSKRNELCSQNSHVFARSPA